VRVAGDRVEAALQVLARVEGDDDDGDAAHAAIVGTAQASARTR
jgi:hypothetical protein